MITIPTRSCAGGLNPTTGLGSARRDDAEDRHRTNQLLILEPGSSRRSARAAAEKEGYLVASGKVRGRGRKSGGVKHKWVGGRTASFSRPYAVLTYAHIFVMHLGHSIDA